MIIQICVGSSCHLKGSEKIVELFGKVIEEHKLENEITLAGSFCTGKCTVWVLPFQWMMMSIQASRPRISASFSAKMYLTS